MKNKDIFAKIKKIAIVFKFQKIYIIFIKNYKIMNKIKNKPKMKKKKQKIYLYLICNMIK